MKIIKKLVMTPIALSLCTTMVTASEVELAESAIFVEGISVNTANYEGVDLSAKESGKKIKRSDFAYITVTPDGKQLKPECLKKTLKSLRQLFNNMSLKV
jgi:hypothetical protein